MKTEIIEYLTYPNTSIDFKVEEMLTSSQVLLSSAYMWGWGAGSVSGVENVLRLEFRFRSFQILSTI